MKIAILADIHGNRVALDEVYKDIEKNQCDKILVLGDLVGYYYDPSYVVEKIKNDKRCIVIRGNHEDLLFQAINDKAFANRCHKKYGSGINVSIESLSNEQLSWLKALPESIKVELDGLKIGLYHGSEKHINEYIYPDASTKRLKNVETEDEYLFFGHTHYPVIFPRKEAVIINPGSVGQPRDIGSLASYAIFNTDNASIVFRRIPFLSQSLIEQSKIKDPHYPYLSDIFERNNPYAKNYKCI
ncbi:MAG: metallophosphoesterase family protein [Endozoicomonadaceae bacterium]|nr:metallophosphoesterase family protein [Endozoicomonadaceae bacterium]